MYFKFTAKEIAISTLLLGSIFAVEPEASKKVLEECKETLKQAEEALKGSLTDASNTYEQEAEKALGTCKDDVKEVLDAKDEIVKTTISKFEATIKTWGETHKKIEEIYKNASTKQQEILSNPKNGDDALNEIEALSKKCNDDTSAELEKIKKARKDFSTETDTSFAKLNELVGGDSAKAKKLVFDLNNSLIKSYETASAATGTALKAFLTAFENFKTALETACTAGNITVSDQSEAQASGKASLVSANAECAKTLKALDEKHKSFGSTVSDLNTQIIVTKVGVGNLEIGILACWLSCETDATIYCGNAEALTQPDEMIYLTKEKDGFLHALDDCDKLLDGLSKKVSDVIEFKVPTPGFSGNSSSASGSSDSTSTSDTKTEAGEKKWYKSTAFFVILAVVVALALLGGVAFVLSSSK